MPDKGRIPEVDPRYLKQVCDRFDEVFADAQLEPRIVEDPDQVKIVIFSDHHKGSRDGADDFVGCEQNYCAALGYYLERGYELFILGDSEELWEENFDAVLKHYKNVFELESEFLETGRGGMVRFYGNHDLDWAKEGSFQRRAPKMASVEMRESLLIQFGADDGPMGQVLFAHGHQGTSESEKSAFISRLFVRHVWRRIQRKFGFSATRTPASDLGLRGQHDRAMFEWTQNQATEVPLALITGHTHRPVFSTPRPRTKTVAEVRKELDSAEQADRPNLRAQLEALVAAENDPARTYIDVDPPCYFNTGCCSFPDGDITALEITGGTISLVRWPDDEGKPSKKLLAAPKSLDEVFTKIRDAEPGSGRIVERRISAPTEDGADAR